ncbi:MAG TPA: PHP domain-containing protein [Acidimicrobiales bacterium]|nr:PHP domain-containing protein [Acidimicrobiales bacterium]
MTAIDDHPHLARPRRPGTVRVDMHTHTMWSGDATTTPEELSTAVAEAGIDVLCITDHNTIKGAVALRDRLPCRVVVGQEVRTAAGELIGLFLTERLPHGVKAPEAAARIRDQGGLVYVPHPYDPMRHCLKEEALDELLEAGLVDVVEVFNAKTSLEHLNRRAAEAAERYGLPGGAGSDAHVPSAFGAAYVEMPDFTDRAGFLDSVRAGTVVGHHYDAARPWRPRIVPSTSSFD